MSNKNVVDVRVGNEIRARRLERGLTGEELAEAVGVATLRVEEWETGKARVPPTTLLLIASVFGSNVARLFGNPEDLELDKLIDGNLTKEIGIFRLDDYREKLNEKVHNES